MQDKKIDITLGLNLKSADVTVDLAEAPANVLFTGTNLMVTEAANLFTSLWKTDNTGTSLDTQISLPTTEAVNYFADWGDGNLEYVEGDGTAKTHTYDTAGTYTVKILTPTGTFSGLQFNNGGDKAKLLDVTQCGCLDISTSVAFDGCSNMTWTATDAPTLSSSSIAACFRNCFNFDGNINDWDVSGVSTFQGCLNGATSFDQDLSSWNISGMIAATNFLNAVTLSTANYDATLIGWGAQIVNSGVSVSFGNSTYTLGGAAEAARDSLIGDGWTITDGGAEGAEAEFNTLREQAYTDGYQPCLGSVAIAQNAFILGLKNAGVYSKLDYLMAMATNGDSNFALYNIIDPANYKATAVNNPLFTTNEGYTGNGVDAYLDWNWSPNDGVNYTINSALFGMYNLTAISPATYSGTLISSSDSATALGNNIDSNVVSYINGTTILNDRIVTAVADTRGLLVADRGDSGVSTNNFQYFNGIKTGEITGRSPDLNIGVPNTLTLAVSVNGNPSNYMDNTVSISFAGASLTAQEHLDLFTLTEAYMDALGKGVVS